MGETLGIDRAEDVTTEDLGGASRWQLAAFRVAVLQYELHARCSEAEAIDAIWAGGRWQEQVAVWADLQLDVADRITGTAPSGGPSERRRRLATPGHVVDRHTAEDDRGVGHAVPPAPARDQSHL
jgi:hypothetical protein